MSKLIKLNCYLKGLFKICILIRLLYELCETHLLKLIEILLSISKAIKKQNNKLINKVMINCKIK